VGFARGQQVDGVELRQGRAAGMLPGVDGRAVRGGFSHDCASVFRSKPSRTRAARVQDTPARMAESKTSESNARASAHATQIRPPPLPARVASGGMPTTIPPAHGPAVHVTVLTAP